MIRILHADVLDALRTLPAGHFDGVLCDPPYHLTQASRGGSPRQNDPATPFGRTAIGGAGFMGKTWDGGDIAFRPEVWAEVLRVCKPGAPLLAFGGTRTFHRLTCAIEDAGWEIRDCISWLYGSGFPKSHNIGKAIDAAAGAKREVVGVNPNFRPNNLKRPDPIMRPMQPGEAQVVSVPATPEAARWDGYSTALKPAWEPCILAMKPLDGTFAQNALAHGVAGLNVDGGRIGTGGETLRAPQSDPAVRSGVVGSNLGISSASAEVFRQAQVESIDRTNRLGRWPANLLFSHLPECKLIGTKKIKGSDRPGHEGECSTLGMFGAGQMHSGTKHADDNGAETVETWECASGCPCAMLDAQSGERPTLTGRADPALRHNHPSIVEHCESMFGVSGAQAGVCADAGGASRFFKTCIGEGFELLFCRAKAILEAWNSELANTADSSSSLQSQLVASALSCAVTLASQGDRRLSDAKGLSMNVTPTELRRLSETLIVTTLIAGSGRLHALSPVEPFPNGCLASIAATPKQTDTTEITISRWKSSGSADAVTFIIMPTNSEPGDLAYQSRFLYCAKADKAEREIGLDGPGRNVNDGRATSIDNPYQRGDLIRRNTHPTVKPIDLCRYLAMLILPPARDGEPRRLLVPFSGSGSEIIGALRAGWEDVTGIEREAEYVEIARLRIQGDAPLFNFVEPA